MVEMREEWRFLHLRAAQLFEEGDVKAALRLLKRINEEQIRLFDKTEKNMNKPRIVSTHP